MIGFEVFRGSRACNTMSIVVGPASDKRFKCPMCADHANDVCDFSNFYKVTEVDVYFTFSIITFPFSSQ